MPLMHTVSLIIACLCHGHIELDETQPWVLMFEFDIQGPGKYMSMLRVAIGEKRIDDAISKAESFLNEHSSRVTCGSRFVPLGGGQETVEDLTSVRRANPKLLVYSVRLARRGY